MNTITIQITKDHTEVMYGIAIKQYKNIKRLKIQNGQSVFRMNVETGVIDIAPNKQTQHLDKFNKPYLITHIQYEMGYLYMPALRYKTACNKFANVLIYVDHLVKINKAKQTAEAASLPSLEGEGIKDEDRIKNNI